MYDYSGDGPPQITGYAASQRFTVLVRELARAGERLAAAVDAGGNAVRLGGVHLEVGEQQALLEDLRAVPMRAGQDEIAVEVSLVWSLA